MRGSKKNARRSKQDAECTFKSEMTVPKEQPEEVVCKELSVHTGHTPGSPEHKRWLQVHPELAE